MAHLLAIDTSSAWCSVALSLEGQEPRLLHEPVSAGASQLLLPWIEELLNEATIDLAKLSAIAIGVGPGAFTGVRLGVAVTQGLAISHNLPIIPVASLDAIAAQLIQTAGFHKVMPQYFVIAIDARMDEIYWAKYESQPQALPKRVGTIHLTKPEDLDLIGIDFIAGSAIKAYGSRLTTPSKIALQNIPIDSEINISALGVLAYAKQMLKDGQAMKVSELEPLYIRNKVALTTAERLEAFK